MHLSRHVGLELGCCLSEAGHVIFCEMRSRSAGGHLAAAALQGLRVDAGAGGRW